MRYTPEEIENLYNEEQTEFSADIEFINWLKAKGATIVIGEDYGMSPSIGIVGVGKFNAMHLAELLVEDKGKVLIIPLESNPEDIIERAKKSLPELKNKEFKIEALAEMNMPYVNDRDWKDNRPFYQKLGNKKKKYGI